MERGVFLMLILVVLLGFAFFFFQGESADEIELPRNAPDSQVESHSVLPDRRTMVKESGVKKKPLVSSDSFATSCPLRVLSSDGRVLHRWKAWVKMKEGGEAKLFEEGDSLSLTNLACAVLISGKSIWPEESVLVLSEDRITVDVQLKNGKRLTWLVKFDGPLDPEPKFTFVGRAESFDHEGWRVPSDRSWSKIDIAFDPSRKTATIENYPSVGDGDIRVAQPYYFQTEPKKEDLSFPDPWHANRIRWDPTAPAAEIQLRRSLEITGRLVDEDRNLVSGVSLYFGRENGRGARLISDATGRIRFYVSDDSIRGAYLSWDRDRVWAAEKTITASMDIGVVELEGSMPLVVMVEDSQGRPIAGAGAQVNGDLGPQRSNELGILKLESVPSDTRAITIGALGHEAMKLDLPEQDLSAHLKAILKKSLVLTVSIEGPQSAIARDCFLVVSGNNILEASGDNAFGSFQLYAALGSSMNPGALRSNQWSESVFQRQPGDSDFHISFLRPGAEVSLQLVFHRFFRIPLNDPIKVKMPAVGEKKVALSISKRLMTTTIKGQIVDSSHRPIAGARVGIVPEDTGSNLSIFADSQGFFSIPKAPSKGFTLRGILGNRVSLPLRFKDYDPQGPPLKLVLPDK